MATLYARDYSPDGQHAGTQADPWPGEAIVNALKALPQPGGGTVIVNNGIWVFDKETHVNGVNDFVLQGESHAAELRFVGGARPNCGQLWFGSAGGFSNSVFENLYINAHAYSHPEAHSAFRFSNARNSEFRNNKELGHVNGGIPGIFWEGGENVKIHHNMFDAPEGGDSTCQIQSLGATANSGFEISDNTFKGCGPVVIGVNNIKILRNTVTSTYGAISILACGTWNTACESVIIDGNTVDCGGNNGAVISGLPNDPGGMSVINNFQITNNTIKGTSAAIHCQSLDGNNYLNNDLAGNEKYNVLIKGNKLHSAWSGSGIDCRGGAGKVDGVLITGNTLSNDAGKPNTVTQDDHTYNVTIADDNVGIEPDGGEPQPEPPQPEPEPPPTQGYRFVAVSG